MEVSVSREKILRRIRKALATPLAAPFLPQHLQGVIYPPPADDLSILFATEFTRLLGQFAYCADEAELCSHIAALAKEKSWADIFCLDEAIHALFDRNGLGQLPCSGQLLECDASITRCEALVARTGSMLLSAAQPQGRTSSVHAPVHVCIAWTSQLVYDVSDAFNLMKSNMAITCPLP